MTDRELQDILKAMCELALIARTYFTELIKQGFEPEEALILTVEFVNTSIKPPAQQAAAAPSPFSRLGNLM